MNNMRLKFLGLIVEMVFGRSLSIYFFTHRKLLKSTYSLSESMVE